MTATSAQRADEWYEVGKALEQAGQLSEAAEAYRNAGVQGNWKGFNNHGCTLLQLGRPVEAIDYFDNALALSPPIFEQAVVHCNKGKALFDCWRYEEAMAAYNRAITIHPWYVEANMSKATAALSMGNFGLGWSLYEWRKAAGCGLMDLLPLPSWLRGRLEGRRLIIESEMGFGDIIQFSRFALLAQRRGARVTLTVPDRLHRLLQGLGSSITVVRESAPLPEFNGRAALMSLPLAFGYGGMCPIPVPYLAAEPERVKQWRETIGPQGVRVGICWRGNQHKFFTPASERSFPLRQFEPLAKIPGVRLISLQRGDGVEQLADLPSGMTVETFGEFDTGADAFVDTAAAMMSLDLVISCDTSIAHLAGALGRPVWLALPYSADWRWLRDRPDSPWYPTMRLFRSERIGDWGSVFAQIGDNLRESVPFQ